jgi:hypothetical protein
MHGLKHWRGPMPQDHGGHRIDEIEPLHAVSIGYHGAAG